VRADQHGVTDVERVLGAAAEQRVLHHHHVAADDDRTEVAGDDSTREHARSGADRDVPGDDGGRCDRGGRIDVSHVQRIFPAVLGSRA